MDTWYITKLDNKSTRGTATNLEPHDAFGNEIDHQLKTIESRWMGNAYFDSPALAGQHSIVGHGETSVIRIEHFPIRCMQMDANIDATTSAERR